MHLIINFLSGKRKITIMNIIKKIALVLPVIAIGLFIFTLSIIDKKDGLASTGVNINTSFSGTSIINSTPESEIPSSKDETSVTEISVISEPPMTDIPEITTISISPSIVTPFSKLPELQPLEKIEPVPVATPSEIVLESIPLINHNTTYTSGTGDITGDESMSDESPLLTGTSSKLPSQTVETTVTSVPEIKIND